MRRFASDLPLSMDSARFSRHPAEVAFDLIGCHLAVTRNGVRTVGRIVETEAYAGFDDAASHSYRMKGPREVMSREPGTIYVYRSYGIHTCFNIVSHRPGETGGVLIRAIEPVEGIEVMRSRRGDVPDRQLGRGPGNVGQALGVQLSDIGESLFGEVFDVLPGEAPDDVWCSPRIGISKATDHPWRFFDPASKCVSAHRLGIAVDAEAVRAEANPVE